MGVGKAILAVTATVSLVFPAHPIFDHALPKLSDYGFFKAPINEQIPISGVIPLLPFPLNYFQIMQKNFVL
ncbi:hypothetical protein Ct9H90mP29_12750 [bacterium]|nr:MAG: hypothetical protein Ct9H90mP29_12750 [bacterium]